MTLEVRHSDEESVIELLESFRNYLRLLARVQMRPSIQSKVDASDIAQDTIIRAFERFEQFRGSTEAELAAWLRQILSRLLADVGRYYQADARKVGRERSLQESIDKTSIHLSQLIPAKSPTASGIARQKEMGILLADAMSELTDEHREVIVLRNLQDQNWATIAELIGRTEDAARMLWTRALQKLRPLLEKRL